MHAYLVEAGQEAEIANFRFAEASHTATQWLSCLWLQIMIRAGFTDASLDAETRALLLDSEHIRESEEGVESVLVLALQTELEAVNKQIQQQQQEYQQLQAR